MKLKSSILLASTAFAVASPASAADVAEKTYTKVAAAVENWTGAYIGVQLGGRWSDATWTTTAYANPIMPGVAAPRIDNGNPASFDSSTVRAGGYAGYNWQFAPQWVLGIEGDIAWGGGGKSLSGIPGTWTNNATADRIARDGSGVKQGWDASVRARLGWLVTPGTLLYGAGGVAWQETSISASCAVFGAWDCSVNRSETAKSVRTGWTAGAGLETRITANAIARLEYRYADYGKWENLFFPAAGIDAVWTSHELKTHTVSVGIAYQFGTH